MFIRVKNVSNKSCREVWRVLSSGIYHCVIYWKSTDVSEEHVTSMFRVKELAKKRTSMKQACLLPASHWFLASLLHVFCWFLACLVPQPWRWRRPVPPKHQLTFNRLHSIISQKIELFTQLMSGTFFPTRFIVFEKTESGGLNAPELLWKSYMSEPVKR
jgi:hypothetical protein